MKKWKSKLIAVVTALCMALSVPVFAGSASVYAATQTMTDSIQFNRMDGVLKKNSVAESPEVYQGNLVYARRRSLS